jgi:adhesin HecA-like repeat protein
VVNSRDVSGVALDPSGVSEHLDDLTLRERELVDAAASGDVLKCSQLSIEQLSVTDDPDHVIRAELLRKLLLKRCDKLPDPRGVRLRGARITGTLDLTGVEAAAGIELRGCSFDHPVLLENAHLPWLTLTGSCVPALSGDGLQVDRSLLLDEGFRATGHGEDGAVRLLGAHIGGQLSLRSAELTNDAGPALSGDRLQVDHDLVLRGLRATGHGEGGAVVLRGAHIGGQLSLRGAELTNDAGPALSKSRASLRTNALPDAIRPAIVEHLTEYVKRDPDAWVFTGSGATHPQR